MASRYVMRVADVVRFGRLCRERAARQALAMPGARENLAAKLGLSAGTPVPEASWGGSKLVATCEVRHTAAVLEWAAENSDGVLVLSQEEQAALVATVQLGMRDIVQQRLDGLRTNMAASLGLEVDTLEPRVTAERAEGERKCDDLRNQAREAGQAAQGRRAKITGGAECPAGYAKQLDGRSGGQAGSA